MMFMGWGIGNGYGWSGWGIGMLSMVLIWGLIIVGIIALIRWFSVQPGDGPSPSRSESALEILKKRYSTGEINKEEFERIKADLHEPPPHERKIPSPESEGTQAVRR